MAAMKHRSHLWGLTAQALAAVLLWLYATAALWTRYLPSQEALPTPAAIVVDMPHAQLLQLLGGGVAVALTTLVGFQLLRTTGAFLALWLSLFGFLGLYLASPSRSAAQIYASHRTDFSTIAAMAQDGELTDASIYGTNLSLRLRYLSSTGRVTWVNGSLFVPRRVVFPNDSAGFWYVPKGSPVGLDMFGTECTQPVHLDQHWWACNITA